jgi:hypothetical protein
MPLNPLPLSSSSALSGRTGGDAGNVLGFTNGEVRFIWHFIRDGAIDADSWRQLMAAWGYCERHAWVALGVEMSFLWGFCMRSADLYLHLIERAAEALRLTVSGKWRSAARRLAERRHCLICELDPRRRGLLSDQRLAEGKDITQLRMFAEASAPLWQHDCCPRCIGAAGSGHLCRRHLIDAIKTGAAMDFAGEYRHLTNVARHLERFEKSMSWGRRGTDEPEDRAALVCAVGWCSGWSILTALVCSRDLASLQVTRKS